MYFCHFLYSLCNVFFWTEKLKESRFFYGFDLLFQLGPYWFFTDFLLALIKCKKICICKKRKLCCWKLFRLNCFFFKMCCQSLAQLKVLLPNFQAANTMARIMRNFCPKTMRNFYLLNPWKLDRNIWNNQPHTNFKQFQPINDFYWLVE